MYINLRCGHTSAWSEFMENQKTKKKRKKIVEKKLYVWNKRSTRCLSYSQRISTGIIRASKCMSYQFTIFQITNKSSMLMYIASNSNRGNVFHFIQYILLIDNRPTAKKTSKNKSIKPQFDSHVKQISTKIIHFGQWSTHSHIDYTINAFCFQANRLWINNIGIK